MSSDKSTSDKILDAAFDLFRDNGVKATTTREIAQSAGVNEVTLFRHFQSKDGVLRAVVEREVECTPMGDLQLEVDFESSDVETVLRSLAGIMRNAMNERSDFMMLILRNVHQHAELVSMLEEMRTPFIEFFRNYMQKQMDAGRLRSMKPHVAAGLLFFPVTHLPVIGREGPAKLIPNDVSADELIDAHIEMYLQYMVIPFSGKETT